MPMRTPTAAAFDPVILWESPTGIRCTSVRRQTGPPFEIIIAAGDRVLRRLAFEHDEDAAAWAISAMYDAERHR